MQRLAFPPPDRSSHLVPIRMSGEPLISGVDSSYPLGGLSPLTHFVLKWWEVEVNDGLAHRRSLLLLMRYSQPKRSLSLSLSLSNNE